MSLPTFFDSDDFSGADRESQWGAAEDPDQADPALAERGNGRRDGGRRSIAANAPERPERLEHDPEKHALGLRPDGWKPVFP